ncbi:multicopper oxidase family protein [Terasakiella sp. A23]|uniref:multicopper oxidase family protein n=1 Tax=Terasakiella sp. FCG-A23 TaxID=3080561 RepID=UPI0029558619|nr:multicopper oxidase family protein [Terasakiella sp. A23]MDV7340241.1 multicopper oxidase family protein [Terasakiella sp. A23]
MPISRRSVIGGSAALVALSAYPLLAKPHLSTDRPMLPKRTEPSFSDQITEANLTAKERPRKLFANGPTLPFWTYSDDPLPIIKVPKGSRLKTHFKNELPEHTSIHWHGIRLPNHMDGIPYVTQSPVNTGENFTYNFTLPDSGLFPFHSHCNTAEQLGRGLAGALLVTGDETQPYDDDVLCIIKDWRLGKNGEFLDFETDAGASRGGTFATVRTANLQKLPVLNVPANADVRLRLMSVNNSRVSQIGIEGHNGAAIIATDGQGVSPFPLKTWRLGSAMRIDVVVRTPAPGGEAIIYDYFAPELVPIAKLKSTNIDMKRGEFDPAPLYAPDIAEPDLSNAIHKRIDFTATATPSYVELPNGEVLDYADSLCLSDKTFWAMNKQTWPEDGHQKLPAPILNLKRNRTYVLELVNGTPHMHPIHIHGHTFLYLNSNKKSLPKHFTDTVLIKPKERIHVAFVADNPGDWMFHCHIIEHAETGMMSILRVT